MPHQKMERVRWWQKEQWEAQGPPGQEPESGAGVKFGWGRGAPPSRWRAVWFIVQTLEPGNLNSNPVQPLNWLG